MLAKRFNRIRYTVHGLQIQFCMHSTYKMSEVIHKAVHVGVESVVLKSVIRRDNLCVREECMATRTERKCASLEEVNNTQPG